MQAECRRVPVAGSRAALWARRACGAADAEQSSVRVRACVRSCVRACVRLRKGNKARWRERSHKKSELEDELERIRLLLVAVERLTAAWRTRKAAVGWALGRMGGFSLALRPPHEHSRVRARVRGARPHRGCANRPGRRTRRVRGAARSACARETQSAHSRSHTTQDERHACPARAVWRACVTEQAENEKHTLIAERRGQLEA
eukprot:6192387-Pleurochrysis_carterae.AAC.4